MSDDTDVTDEQTTEIVRPQTTRPLGPRRAFVADDQLPIHLRDSAIPLTERQFADQERFMQWVTTAIVRALVEGDTEGRRVADVLSDIGSLHGNALVDLFYGLQYADEVGAVTVSGDSLRLGSRWREWLAPRTQQVNSPE